MSKLLNLLVIIFLILFMAKITSATDSRLYIAEPIIENDIETAKTRINIFKPDGTKLKEVIVNGIMARISPDKKHIVYLHGIRTPMRIVLTDVEGKEVKNLPVYRQQKGVIAPRTANLIWSPDAEKIAIISDTGGGVTIGVFNLKSDDMKFLYGVRTRTSEEAYAVTVKWFPDSKHILLVGAEGSRIINIESREPLIISKESKAAYLTGNGKKIIYVTTHEASETKSSAGNTLSDIWLYDVEKQSKEKLLTSDNFSAMAALSLDGRYLVFQNFPIQEESIFIINIFTKKLTKMVTKGFLLIPKIFSPTDSNLILCIELRENKDNIIAYGILNLDNGKLHKLKETTLKNLEGDLGRLWLMGFLDWYDWR